MLGKLTKSAKQCEMLKYHGEEGKMPLHHHFTFLNKISQSLPTKEGKFSDVIDVIDSLQQQQQQCLGLKQVQVSPFKFISGQHNIIF